MPAEPGRVVLLVVSPRTAPGLLTHDAWTALATADAVLAAGLDPAWAAALAPVCRAVADLDDLGVDRRAGELVTRAAAGESVVWFGSPDGDAHLTDALAEHLARHAVAAEPPTIEVIVGAYDVPGSRLLDLVAVMDRLRSPGGCPWDAEQTHTSLVPYLVEETYEVLDTIETASGEVDREHLREELGDLLLQVAFHSRIAQEHPDQPFDIDEVAAGIVDKLIRRHPHVFADVEVSGADEVIGNWEQIKAAERAGRSAPEDVFAGIPRHLPALARAQKMLDRLDRLGGGDDPLARVVDPVAAALLRAVQAARDGGVDAEATLRAALDTLPGA